MRNFAPYRVFETAALAIAMCSPVSSQGGGSPVEGDGARVQSDGPKSCQAEVQRLAAKALELRARAQAHNDDAVDHAEKYRMEIAVCELAKKSNLRPQLEACLSLLDRAEARAERGNKIGRQLAADTAGLRAEFGLHNERCPNQQIQLLQQ